MTWETFYLICFVLGLSLTLLSFAGVFSHLQFGHFHLNLGHGHGGGHAAPRARAAGGKGGISPFNGFTLAAFLGWFGGCGYLLERYANFLTPIVLGVATLTGLGGRGDPLLVPGKGAVAARAGTDGRGDCSCRRAGTCERHDPRGWNG